MSEVADVSDLTEKTVFLFANSIPHTCQIFEDKRAYADRTFNGIALGTLWRGGERLTKRCYRRLA